MKIKKIFIICLVGVIIALIGVGGFLVYKEFFSGGDNKKKNEVVDKIKGYNYSLENGAPKEYKKMFESLVKTLKQSEIDEEEYASLVARMFVYDFYDIKNKMSKNDVGGTQFVLASSVDNFVLEAGETTYKYVEHNIYGDRQQSLPEVSSVAVAEIKKEKFNYKTLIDDNAYNIKLDIIYKEETTGYPKTVTVKLIHTTFGEEENSKTKLEVIYLY